MEKINIKLDHRIRVSKASLPEDVIAVLEKRLIFKNPLYETNKHYCRPNYNIRPKLECIWHDDDSGDLVMARGFLGELVRIFHANRLGFELTDSTLKLPEVDFEFQGSPYGYQYKAWHEVPKHRFGILAGPIGCGKKVLALSLVTGRKVPALAIVTTKRQFYLWKDAAARFMGLEDHDIGLVGDGHRRLGKSFTIAITLSLYKLMDELKEQIGFVIVDQCNRVNLKVFFKASLFNAPYMLGLATGKRSDGLTGLMQAYMGPRICEVWPEDGWTSFQGLGKARPTLKIQRTGFNYEYHDDWSDMILALCQDPDRNALIVADILQETADPGAKKAMVISERVGHLEDLRERIEGAYGEAEIITGETLEAKREEIFRRFDRGKLAIVLVTLKSIHTLEIKRANCVFVASPVKYGDHLTQIVGKLLGAGQGEQPRAKIFDYRDKPELLKVSLKRRLKVYRSIGAVDD